MTLKERPQEKDGFKVSKFKLLETDIKDLYIIEPTVYEDERGFFMESYNEDEFYELGLYYNFIQDNHSKSKKGVLRGLHFQRNFPQAKLVRVTKGTVFDVAVDLREGSPTFGKHQSVILSEQNKQMFMIPRGFAHGFLVLTDEAEFEYKVDEIYNPEDEDGIIWNDPTINISWPTALLEENHELILSEKDKKWRTLYEWQTS